ncbi:SsrA-binding protein SmpB [Candidatus Sumerlaeota bacterium]|nr:SsrA-binding protein SmpB [Candidatus Sumerlaeota bacterium]
MSAKKDESPGVRMVAQNRKARHRYHIEQTWEAGIALRGTEVKSLRAGQASLSESYAEIHAGEVYINNFHIPPYEQGNRFNVDATRQRKLLLHKREIKKLVGAVTQKGYTLVPLRVYFRGQRAKVEIALARGKKEYDKRQDIKERESRREMDRARKSLKVRKSEG